MVNNFSSHCQKYKKKGGNYNSIRTCHSWPNNSNLRHDKQHYLSSFRGDHTSTRHLLNRHNKVAHLPEANRKKYISQCTRWCEDAADGGVLFRTVYCKCTIVFILPNFS